MKNVNLKLIALALIAVSLICSCTETPQAGQPQKAKYVFYFIGDGMGFSHIALTEAYLATREGKIGSNPVCFSQFPVMGMATTYSHSNYITCSSAAGTALSTGYKTNNGMLGVTPDTSDLTSISYKIHEAGYPVGIMTTVTIDHATPGAFYARSANRNDYYKIATQLPKTNFEFFGGGGFVSPTGKEKDQPSVYGMLEEDGYTVAYGMEDYASKKASAEKMVLFQEKGKEDNILPYAIERKENDLTLKQVVEAAIEFLDKGNGFFVMAEGGKIDWAAHSNDIANTIFETLDMSDAIEVAYRFYEKHPDETLIVVTADHETGGVALGRNKGYVFDLSGVDSIAALRQSAGTNVQNYMDQKTLDADSEKAMIGWTTISHTGGAVPVFAVGAGSEAFAGRMDNTDIPKKICAAMGVAY